MSSTDHPPGERRFLVQPLAFSASPREFIAGFRVNGARRWVCPDRHVVPGGSGRPKVRVSSRYCPRPHHRSYPVRSDWWWNCRKASASRVWPPRKSPPWCWSCFTAEVGDRPGHSAVVAVRPGHGRGPGAWRGVIIRPVSSPAPISTSQAPISDSVHCRSTEEELTFLRK